MIKKCEHCKHGQSVSDKNVYQDIKGKFIICEKCKKFCDIEGDINHE